jgi:glycosyltransferase involved in cell wall biosynthesis
LDVPLVSTDVADIGRFIPECYLAHPGDVSDLKSKVSLMLERLPQVHDDFSACYSKAKEEFSFESMIKKTMDLYVNSLHLKP